MNPRTNHDHDHRQMRGRHGHHDFSNVMADFGPPFGRGRGRGGRRRMRRGDTRAAILVLLDEQAANGYRLMQEIEQRSEGAWRPSPGSVYPALQQLEDEGLVAADKADGRKSFALTDDGKQYVKANREKLGEPWKGLGPDLNGPSADFWRQVKPLLEAVRQVGQVGDDNAAEAATEVLAEARRRLYAILAEQPIKS
jgi:DNA-binding PadR family transcriptional regulator